MKKVLFLLVIVVLALMAGCKKKVEPVEAPPPPPPLPKQTEQEFIKGLVSHVPRLEPGKTLEVQIDKNQVLSNESKAEISLFPLEFISPAEKPYVVKYLFPAVVWKLTDSQLPVWDLPDYLDNTRPGEKIWILKDSPNPKEPFENIPTLLVKIGEKELVLNNRGDEMPRR